MGQRDEIRYERKLLVKQWGKTSAHLKLFGQIKLVFNATFFVCVKTLN